LTCVACSVTSAIPDEATKHLDGAFQYFPYYTISTTIQGSLYAIQVSREIDRDRQR